MVITLLLMRLSLFLLLLLLLLSSSSLLLSLISVQIETKGKNHFFLQTKKIICCFSCHVLIKEWQFRL